MEIDFHHHLLARMNQRGVARDEVLETLERGRPGLARQPAEARVRVFAYGAEWKGHVYAQKEVTVYFKRSEGELIVLSVIARYGTGFPREG